MKLRASFPSIILTLILVLGSHNIYAQQPDLVPWDIYEMFIKTDDPDPSINTTDPDSPHYCANRRTLRFGLKTGNLGGNFT